MPEKRVSMGERGCVSHVRRMLRCAVLCLLFVSSFCAFPLQNPSIPREFRRISSQLAETQAFIVEFEDNATHTLVKESLEVEVRALFAGSGQKSRETAQAMARNAVGHEYSHAFNGMAVKGVPRSVLERLPGVKNVHVDGVMHVSTVPWGLDRIDQKHLPLDGKYQTQFKGAGVNVRVINIL